MDESTQTPMPAVDVAAGLIFRQGQLLIARRYPEAHCGGLWEFPGGKRERSESFEAALQRELREELGIETTVGELVEEVEHAYPARTVRIRFFRCRIKTGEPRALGCDAIKWVDRSTLLNHAFPEADARLLDRLVGEDELWAAFP